MFDLRQPQLARPGLPAGPLPRGQVLVLGGDQVYPVAKREYYEDRLVGPLEAARPRLFAIPGNHDWYDGLTNFTKIFCQGHSLGNWHTQQERSYFAVELPHGWWLWGTGQNITSGGGGAFLHPTHNLPDRLQLNR